MKKYRCGWCGHPTDEKGNPIKFDRKTVDKEYKDAEKLDGACCPQGSGIIEDNWDYVQVTRSMARDAGDPSLEGQWIKW